MSLDCSLASDLVKAPLCSPSFLSSQLLLAFMKEICERSKFKDYQAKWWVNLSSWSHGIDGPLLIGYTPASVGLFSSWSLTLRCKAYSNHSPIAQTRPQSGWGHLAGVIYNLAAKQPCHEVHVTTWLGWLQSYLRTHPETNQMSKHKRLCNAWLHDHPILISTSKFD